MSSVKSYSPRHYPPYGHMVIEWEKLTLPPKTPPGDWDGKIDYGVWLDSIARLLSKILWPRYVRADHAWKGAARKIMHDLTMTDFRLIQALRLKIDEDAGISSRNITHKELFFIEDEVLLDKGPHISLKIYLSGKASDDIIDKLSEGYLSGVSSKCGMVDLDVKVDMQRPRAYQMAWLLDREGFTYEHAKSAVSPSMISGHCIETLTGGVAAYPHARDMGCSQDALDALARHTVDIGDRRVFAGVHYPSDNISSWLTGLLLYPHVAPDDDGAGWLWQAIWTHSSVYRAIMDEVKVNPSSPYRRSMSLLAAVGAGEIMTVDAALASVAK